MLEKSRNAAFFQWFVCRVSQKVGSLKRRVRSHVVRGEIKKLHATVARSTFSSQNVRFGALFEVEMLKNCTPLWREAHFQVKMLKIWGSQTTFWSSDVEQIARRCGEKHIFKSKCQVRSTFWSWDVEKLHAAVARSTFPSQNVKNLRVSDHFLKFRCWTLHAVVARSTFSSQNVRFGALFEVEMLKNCTPLWREAHFQVKMLKIWGSQTTFWSSDVEQIARRCGEKHIFKSKCQVRSTFWSWDVEKLHAAVARSTFPSQNVKNLRVSDHFLKFRCWTNCTPLWREAHFQVKMSGSEHFLKLRCWKIARRCGEKHISKSKC